MLEAMKTVIITGSSSGFGFLAAKTFAKKGYSVWATMRHAGTKNKTKKAALERFSSNIKVADMDVDDQDSVQAAIKAIHLEDGRIDVLINNAGIMHLGITEAFSVGQAHQQMNTNFYGIIRTIQAVLPLMREAGTGLIINTGSTLGRMSFPFTGTYSASKFAVEGYTQSLKYELAQTGVEAVLVEPGPFPTNLISSQVPEDRTEIVAEYTDLKKVRNATIDSCLDFLQSDEAPNPQMVVDAYVQLVETKQGERPTRTQVGIAYGVDQINQLTQPIQDASLKNCQLDFLLATKVS